MNKEKFKKWLMFFCNPRLLFCFGLAWLVTNGWAYIMLGFGTYLNITWMIAVSGAYLTVIWLPISPEKIVTVAITMALLRVLFPHDEKTLAVLKEFRAKMRMKKKSHMGKREQRRRRKKEILAFAKKHENKSVDLLK
jgi:hypothetical protein